MAARIEQEKMGAHLSADGLALEGLAQVTSFLSKIVAIEARKSCTDRLGHADKAVAVE